MSGQSLDELFRKSGYEFISRASDDAPLGRIGDWALQSVLAQGGFAFVVLAQKSPQEPAAIKILFKKFCDQPELVEQFLSEAKVARELWQDAPEHPPRSDGLCQLLRFKESGTEDSVPWIAMEYVGGRMDGDPPTTLGQVWRQWRSQQLRSDSSLVARLQEEPEPRWDAFIATAVIWQAARGVAKLHKLQKSFLHGDLHPQNVILTHDLADRLLGMRALYGSEERRSHQLAKDSLFGDQQRSVVKVIDFGLARPSAAVTQAEHSSLHFHPAVQIGVAQYMAPEQFAIQEQQAARYRAQQHDRVARRAVSAATPKLSPATDVYCLACLLFELLTGQPPFQGNASTIPFMQRQMDPFFPDFGEEQSPIPEELQTICLNALQREPRWRRYRDASEFAADLETWLSQELARREPSPARHPAPRASKYIARCFQPHERIVRWCGRHTIAMWLILTLVLLSVTMIFVGFREFQHLNRERLHDIQRITDEFALKHEAELKQQATQQAQATFSILDEVFRSAAPLGLDLQSPGTGDFLPTTFATRRGSDSTDNIDNMLGVAGSQLKLLHGAPRRQAQLMQVIGRTYRSIGEHSKARAHLEEALRIRREEQDRLQDDVPLATKREDVAETLVDLGWTLQDYGDFEQAERRFQEALRIRQALHGTESRQVAATQLHLGWLFADMNHQLQRHDKGEEAEKLIRQALQTLSLTMGPGARETGIAHLEFGSVLLMRGKNFDAAIELAKALAILSQFRETRELAEFYRKYLEASQLRLSARNLPEDQFEKAQDLYNQSKQEYFMLIREVRLILGPRHPIVLMLIGDYAGLLRQKGDLPEAEAEIRNALEHARKSPLRGHPFMIQATNELAKALKKRGAPEDLEEARTLFNESLGYCKQRFDLSHPLYQETQRLAQEN